MQFQHFSTSDLIGEAGGAPWAVNNSLQVGRPGRVALLAKAFHAAGRCTTESSAAFGEAQRRFEAAWNHEDGAHPINDSVEVQRATQSLRVQDAQLPKIGIDLENIAAALAEAQRTAAGLIATLEGQLRVIDDELGRALRLEQCGHLTAAEKNLVDEHITALEREAIADTKASLGQLQSLRGGYCDYLQRSIATLRVTDGYDPEPIQGTDADGQPNRADQDQNAVDHYTADQRAKDDELANGAGSSAVEKADAAARLRDYTTATSPNADGDARRLASERLEDFAMAGFSGPLPMDPVLGVDARSRAQMRLEWQRKLEQGLSGTPAMSPDRVTQLLDNSEQQARVVITQQAAKTLERGGMSPSAAVSVVGRLAQGTPLSNIAHYNSTLVGSGGAGLEHSAGALSTGVRNSPGSIGVLSKVDAEALKGIGKRLGVAGSLADLALAQIEVSQGAPAGRTFGQAFGGIGGGTAGGWGAGVLGGMWLGPGGAFVGGIVGAVAGGWGVGKVGGAIGSQFDH
jgi:hypothetical protein